MSFISLFVLALAVSLDNLGVGITYGLRKIKIPIPSIIIIQLASGLMILLAMQIGVWITYFLPEYVTKWIGSGILILIGIWAILQVLRSNEGEVDQINSNELMKDDVAKVISIEIKKLGLVIQILRTPTKADIDKSGVISATEAIFLGLALSLDAFGAGIGAAFIGFNPWLTAGMIALMSGLFILLGLKIGFWFSGANWLQKFSIVPGIILILIGIIKIF